MLVIYGGGFTEVVKWVVGYIVIILGVLVLGLRCFRFVFSE